MGIYDLLADLAGALGGRSVDADAPKEEDDKEEKGGEEEEKDEGEEKEEEPEEEEEEPEDVKPQLEEGEWCFWSTVYGRMSEQNREFIPFR